MLKQLSIKNIAIIEQLDLSFDRGLTVITGESGSGKSILLDAIALAFGAKVSPRDILRAGAERGQVELLFDIGSLSAADADRLAAFMAEQGVALLPGETEVLLSREFTGSSSRSRVNGIPVTREVLEQLRPWVIDLHGQHELTSLFHKETQRQYLDATGGPEMGTLKAEVVGCYEAWHGLKQQLEALAQNRQAWEREKEFMAFQLAELTEAQLTTADEDEQARQELALLSHAEKRIQAALQGASLLTEGDGPAPALLDQLGKLEKKLSEAARYDPTLEAMLNRLQGNRAELKELAAELDRYGGRVEADPERMAYLTDRLDTLEKLKRKYGPELRDVLAKRDELAQALSQLEASTENVEALQAGLIEQEGRLAQACARLSARRQELAESLKAQLLAQLQGLAMPAVSFDIRFLPTEYSREGVETVEFWFSANPGEPLKPLAKVASGGELSRFLLAMKVLTAHGDGLLTLVFDEIDSGISGPTAKAVAENLAMLARHLQVLAITHQPMIAAMGREHLHVEKQVVPEPDGEAVCVRVEALGADEDRRLKVLSRLVSGTDTGDAAVAQFIRRLRQEAVAFEDASSPARSR